MQKVPTMNKISPVFQRKQTLEKVKSRIAPAWPLKNLVAVNPYHGYTEDSFEKTAQLLNQLAGIQLYMPLAFYQKLISEKRILKEDIEDAIKNSGKNHLTAEQILLEVYTLKEDNTKNTSFETIIDLGEKLTHIKLNDFFVESISTWASAYFSKKRNPDKENESDENLFSDWRSDALIDYSTNIIGIKQFKSVLKRIPDDSESAFHYVLDQLGLTTEQLTFYLLQLYYKLSGWSAFISGIDWDNNLYGGKTNHLNQFMSILLSWEFCVFQSLKEQGLEVLWTEQLAQIKQEPDQMPTDYQLTLKNTLQDALDIAAQRELRGKFESKENESFSVNRPEVQAVFCIDVRSEVFRRNLEAVDPTIQTIGFAGFFGFPIKYKQIGNSEMINQCPVLLASEPLVKESIDSTEKRRLEVLRTTNYQTGETIKRFKSGAISSFGFVSSMGLFFLPKLLSDSFNLTRTTTKSAQKGYRKNYLLERKLDLSEFSMEDQLEIALNTLNATGLNQQLSSIVLLTGHGSSTVNNPHAAGLECGACGGHSGDINALVAATVFNKVEIRSELAKKGIQIPEDTIFLAGLHDTTTDKITILNSEIVKESHREAFEQLLEKLELASSNSRIERSIRLNIHTDTIDKNITNRSRDWAQVRPEWGLAGCNSFIIAPRTKTKSLNLGGRAFLHDYHFSQDRNLTILEGIMTAPMVVTTWINLQYYASTVDNKHFGAGDKTLHNVTAGIGVLEGSAGDLRIGLPLQSVHNGTDFEHLPQRLTVIIDAPIDAINQILAKHENIRNLFDNKWIHLLRLNPDGIISDQYMADFEWKSFLSTKKQPVSEKQQLTIME